MLRLNFFLFAVVGCLAGSIRAETFRPPSVPLIACDPYFSVWSPGDKLTDVNTTHWTGKPQRLASLARIDGKSFRLLGINPAEIAALPQKELSVLPTRTIATFEGQGIRLTMTFMTPALPEDLDILSRPVTYITWTMQATDGQKHEVQIYFDGSSELAVNTPDQAVNVEAADTTGIRAFRAGTVEQSVLKKKGDDLRIDWGYFYIATTADCPAKGAIGSAEELRAAFMAGHSLSASPAASVKNDARNETVMSFTFNGGSVTQEPVSYWAMVAYDDLYSIQYMKSRLRPYWRRNGWEAADLLQAAAKDYPALQKRCAAFDEELMADLRKAGGENYAKLAALAYRQCFAAGKFAADANGQPLQFCKENHSNGCISTSDVFYPMSPQFLFFNATLAKSFLVPFMDYAASDHWKFPFAPHDLGTYPHADGQVYGDGERGLKNQMPVEESGNLLCLFGAVAQIEGNADFAKLYWKQLDQWAAYVKDKGFDPENQLCTDDFAGHLAHNVNLSAKAICALGAFAKLCEMTGDTAKAQEYGKTAHDYAQRWVKEADDGDHFRLAFDRPGSWSQKYNLVWDGILGLNLFSADVAKKELAFYKTKQNVYGLPLDNRQTYTKLDWTTWTATLTQNPEDFQALVDPLVKFLNETPDRSPMSDWYQTKTAKKVGFTARPVVGGVFLRMLYDKTDWQKYAARDKTRASHWAPLPLRPYLTMILPAADTRSVTWRYTTNSPSENWRGENFDDSAWLKGKSGFGTEGTPGAVVGTTWHTDDIWLRREVVLNAQNQNETVAWLHHDEDAEVYINGVLAVKANGFSTGYDAVPMTPAGRSALRAGKNLIAIHCHQTAGGQYVDFGLVDIRKN